MDQQFSLSWNNFHGNLTKGFAGLLGNGEFVDVTIAVEGHLLQAHKVILSICSPYFKQMFQSNPCQHPIVVLKDVSHKAMKDLLQFMYHGEVSVKREELTSFIGTAEVLQIKGLTNKETDEEDSVKQQDLSKRSVGSQNDVHEGDSVVSDTVECSSMPEEISHIDLDLIKHRDYIEKLQRICNLKRKSEEILQKSYYSDLMSSEKRSKFKEKPFCKLKNATPQQNYENFKNLYDDKALDISTTFNTHLHSASNTDKDLNENTNDQSTSESNIDLKTECDDLDIIVTDPAVCTTPKSFDGSRENKSIPLEYQSPQDNCSGISALFLDLKNFVNGKVTNNTMRKPLNEDILRHTVNHRLVTIPQKEDGKKKYPQRSCRLCWKIGKRRDTRFMCNACEMPFCKSPCFEIHFNDVIKVSQLQGDYYAA